MKSLDRAAESMEDSVVMWEAASVWKETFPDTDRESFLLSWDSTENTLDSLPDKFRSMRSTVFQSPSFTPNRTTRPCVQVE